MKWTLVFSLAAVLVSGCASGGATPTLSSSSSAPLTATVGPTSASPSPGPATPSPSPSPTVVQSFPPPEPTWSADQLAVNEALQRYLAAIDHHSKHPELTDMTDLTQTTVTGSEEFHLALDEVGYLKERGWKVVGDSQMRDLSISVAAGTATTTYCFDPTAVVVVDAATGEPAGLKPPKTYRYTTTLERGKEARWRVAVSHNKPVSC